MFADVWLGTDLVESSVSVGKSSFLAVAHLFQVYDGQSSFINNLALTSAFSKFGMPVDSVNSDTGVVMSS
jgi:hypothetical protein